MSRQLLVMAVGALLVVPALHATDKPAKPSKPTAERVELVRQMYGKLPSDILGIAEPVILAGVGWGGTDARELRSVILKDANGKKLEISLAWWTKTVDSLTLNEGREGLLPDRGPEESAVYGLLLRLPKEDREGPGVAEFLTILDKRFAGAMPGRASR
jgi:hypothetical protein